MRTLSGTLLAAQAAGSQGGVSGDYKVDFRNKNGGFVNGGFETGDFTGWTETDPDSVCNVDNVIPRTGTWCARFNTASASLRQATLVQTITDPTLSSLHVAVDVWTYQTTIFSGGAGSYWNLVLADDQGNSATTGNLAGSPNITYTDRLLEIDTASNATLVTLTITWYKAGGGDIYDVRVDDIGWNLSLQDKTRILHLLHVEQTDLSLPNVVSMKTTVVMDNSDGVLNSYTFKGKGVVVSYGVDSEYSACAPQWVMDQRDNAIFGGKNAVVLDCEGIFDLMLRDEASATFTPAAASTVLIGEWITDAIQASGTSANTVFSHCVAYTATTDSAETLLTTLTPKDGFNVGYHNDRATTVHDLLDEVKSVALPKADGAVHIILPTVAGTAYIYTYDNSSDTTHTYSIKNRSQRLVAPNYVTVASLLGAGTVYSASTASTAANALVDIRTFRNYFVANTAEAASIGVAVITKLEMQADKGAIISSINCGQEVYDYVNVIDASGSTIVGNVSRIQRMCGPNIFEQEIRFGSLSGSQFMPITPRDIGDFSAYLPWFRDVYTRRLDQLIEG